MPDSTADVRALVERVRFGDDEALAELMQCYEAEVRLTARILLGRALRPHLDSVDLVQSVYHSLLVGLRENKIEIGTPQQFLGLAVTIVRSIGHKQEVKAQQELASAMDVVSRPVSAKPAGTPGDDESFATEREKDEAIVKTLEAFRQQFPKSDAAVTAALTEGQAQLRLEQYDAALANFEKLRRGQTNRQ